MVEGQLVVFAVGIIGNIISFMVFLSPMPTFYKVYKKKSTEGFQSLPYVVALFSCMLWVFYALLKTNAPLLITINSFGSFIETLYIIMYLVYAPVRAKIVTIRTVVLLNVTTFGMIVACILLLSRGDQRVIILGWICVGFSVSVFAAPLFIMREVIRTKSVEFMPFTLSFFLTLNAAAWLCYGVVLKDKFVAMPNILGLLFGTLQMLLYCIYKDAKVKGAMQPVKAAAVPEIAVDGFPLSIEKELEPTINGGSQKCMRGQEVIETGDADKV